jgi:hypothetical protein
MNKHHILSSAFGPTAPKGVFRRVFYENLVAIFLKVKLVRFVSKKKLFIYVFIQQGLFSELIFTHKTKFTKSDMSSFGDISSSIPNADQAGDQSRKNAAKPTQYEMDGMMAIKNAIKRGERMAMISIEDYCAKEDRMLRMLKEKGYKCSAHYHDEQTDYCTYKVTW